MLEIIEKEGLREKIQTLFKIVCVNNNLYQKSKNIPRGENAPIQITNNFLLDEISQTITSKNEKMLESSVYFLTNIIGMNAQFRAEAQISWYFSIYQPDPNCLTPVFLTGYERPLEPLKLYSVSAQDLNFFLEDQKLMGCHLMLVTSCNQNIKPARIVEKLLP